MSEPEIKMISDFAVKVGKLEVLQEANARAITDLATGVDRLVSKLDQTDDIAREADQRTKSAHHRIDELKVDTEKKVSSVQDDIKWLWRTVLGTLITGGVAGAAALVWKSIGS